MSNQNIHKTRDYFDRRAARYALALKTFPMARILDLVPYLYVFSDYQKQSGLEFNQMKVLDAFGGTGFLHHSFRHSGLEMHVADCSPQMLSLGDASIDPSHWHHADDYFEQLSYTNAGSYDIVISHGGLHHVVIDEKGTVDPDASELAKFQVIQNLSRLIMPGGILIITDIPDAPPTNYFSGKDLNGCSQNQVLSLLGLEQLDYLNQTLNLRPGRYTLSEISEQIRARFSSEPIHQVPRHFFDNFVQNDTPLGHIAHFLQLDKLLEFATSANLEKNWQLNYRGPWLFSDSSAAGWYFREKFSFGNSAAPSIIPETEQQVAEIVSRELGTRLIAPNLFSTNWGVTCSCFTKS